MSAEFIEACHHDTPDEREWVLRLCSALAPLLGPHRGLGAYTYALDEKGAARILDMYHEPREQEVAEHPTRGKRAFLRLANGCELGKCFTSSTPRAIALSDLGPTAFRALEAHLPPNASDSVGLLSGAYQDVGINLCCVLDSPLPRRSATHRFLSALSLHLAASFRARRLVQRAALVLDAAAAIATPDGSIAAMSTRSDKKDFARRFVAAVRTAERVKSRRLRKALGDVHAEMEAFVCGEHSLVETVDSDGKRWLVAVRTRVSEPVLTARERQVAGRAARGLSNKLIAAELGVSTRTVAGDLRSALVKLGLPGRAALSPWFSRL